MTTTQDNHDMRRLLFIVFSLLIVPSFTPAGQVSTSTMYDVINRSPSLSRLAQALEVVDPALLALLQNRGNYTLLAPDNDAIEDFAVFLDIPLEDLLQSQRVMTDFIAYHMVVGRITDDDIRGEFDAAILPTLLPNTFINFDVRDADGTLLVNDVVTILTPNLAASNGLIHIISDVAFTRILLEKIEEFRDQGDAEATPIPRTISTPTAPETITCDDTRTCRIDDILASDDRFTLLLSALRHAQPEAINRLGSRNDYTLFAPTDDVFIAMLDTLRLNNITQIDPQFLGEILLYHMLPQSVTLAELEANDRTEYSTALFGEFIVARNNPDDGLSLNRFTQVVEADIIAENGIVHVVDAFFVPEISFTFAGVR